MRKLGRLKKRAEFLRLAGKGRKAASPGLVLQAAPRSYDDMGGVSDSSPSPGPAAPLPPPDQSRVGFTCSRKVGNAVARNRAKRRLRAAASAVLPQNAREDYDFVIIGRPETLVRPYALLLQDLLGSLKRVGALKEPT
jgi:ribonuclease P protein component